MSSIQFGQLFFGKENRIYEQFIIFIAYIGNIITVVITGELEIMFILVNLPVFRYGIFDSLFCNHLNGSLNGPISIFLEFVFVNFELEIQYY